MIEVPFHLARHKKLFRAVDELAADFLRHHPSEFLGTCTLEEFLEWSAKQAEEPTIPEDSPLGIDGGHEIK